MPDYSQAKIYKLVSSKSPDIYIGSCLMRLSTRLCGHKNKSNRCVSKKLFAYDAIITIVLIEDYPCENKNMLKARELYHITNNICINVNKPFVCDIFYGDGKEYKKQYYIANADKFKEDKKEYYLANIDKIKEDHKEYYLANAEKLKEDKKEYYLANIDKIKEYNSTHKEQRNTRDRTKRAEKKLAQDLYII